MEKTEFYNALRPRSSSVFGTSISKSQVAGMEAILDEALRRDTPLAFLAYMLATVYLETAHTMQPIHERGPRSYFDKYEPSTKIGKMLGNTKRGDGYLFRGRGLPMLTGRRNYALASKKLGVDFVANPDLVLRPQYAIPIMFDGMSEGWFTGKALADYIDDVDEPDAEDLREFTNARRVINGVDKAKLIGSYALSFEAALRASDYGTDPIIYVTPEELQPEPGPEPIPEPTPMPTTPVVDAFPPAVPAPTTARAALSWLFSAFTRIWKQKED